MRSVFLVFAVGCAGGPTVDGGWQGRAICENDAVLDTEAILDTSPDDDSLEGIFFIDLEVDLGLLGIIETVQRGEITNGAVSSDGTMIQGDLERDPNATAGYARNYAFELAADDDFAVLEGSLDWVNGQGDVALACELELEALDLD